MPAPLQTSPTEVLQPDVDETPETGSPKVAHIVKPDGGNAAARVLEARIYGTPLEALCGEVFVPQRDPTKLPLCAPCKEIYDLYRTMNDGVGDTPSS
jgi:hypothetical protein